MEVGQPSTGAPKRVVEALRKELDSGDTMGYTLAMGINPLKQEIAKYYQDRHGVEVDPSRICITTGIA